MGLFCVDHLLTGMDPALVVVYIPSETSLKKKLLFSLQTVGDYRQLLG